VVKTVRRALATISVTEWFRESLASPRACSVEQSWNNVHAKSLHFPASPQKHCSIDLRFFLARGPRE